MKGKNRLFFWAIIIAAIIFLTIIIVQIAKPNNQGHTLLTDTEWIKGSPTATVSLIEYSDFQCPACAIYYHHTKRLAEEYGDQIQIIYRHFPLDQIHPQATLAARAAEAAGQQGMFWQMHDLLFENQDAWSGNNNADDLFIDYASQLGLDTAKFASDLDHDDIKAAVRDDQRSGLQANVEGTPTFYLNGNKINNPTSYDKFRQLINAEINQ